MAKSTTPSFIVTRRIITDKRGYDKLNKIERITERMYNAGVRPRMFMQAIMAGHRVQAEAPGKHFSPDRKRYPLETLCLLITVDVMSVMRVTTMHREDPLAHWVIRYKKITQ